MSAPRDKEPRPHIDGLLNALVEQEWRLLAREVPGRRGYRYDAKLQFPESEGEFQIYLEALSYADDEETAEFYIDANLPVLYFRDMLGEKHRSDSQSLWGLVTGGKFVSFETPIRGLATYLTTHFPDVFPTREIRKQEETSVLPTIELETEMPAKSTVDLPGKSSAPSISIDALNSPGYLDRAEALILQGDYSEASDVLKNTYNQEGIVDAIRTEQIVRNFDDTEQLRAILELCSVEIERHPERSELFALRSDVLRRLGRFEEASQNYSDAIQRFPQDAALQDGFDNLVKALEQWETNGQQEQRQGGGGDEKIEIPTKPSKPASTLRPFQDDASALHDAAELRPGLNFERIARCMVALIEDIIEHRNKEEQGPTDRALITFGLYGPWGAGKSTLINALKSAFQNRSKKSDRKFQYILIPLNPWKWDGRRSLHGFVRDAVLKTAGETLFRIPVPAVVVRMFVWWQESRYWVALLVCLVITSFFMLKEANFGLLVSSSDSSNADISNRLVAFVQSIWASGDRLSAGASTVVLVAIWVAKNFGKSAIRLGAKLIPGAQFLKKNIDVGATDLERIYRYLAPLVSAGERKDKRFVFFVDDLDRCTPEIVADFLESTHSLTAAGCVTFLACDDHSVAAALNARYEKIVANHKDGKDFGRKFLEKIVQVPFRLPAVDEQGLRDLGLMGAGGGASKDLPPRGGSNREGQGENGDPSSLEIPPPESTEEADKEPPDFAKLSAIIDDLLHGKVTPLALNIRQVKSLINTLKLHLSIAEAAVGDERSATCFAAFLFADNLDPEWLDGTVLRFGKKGKDAKKESSQDDQSSPGAIARHENIANNLREKLGTDLDLIRSFYARIGRPPPV